MLAMQGSGSSQEFLDEVVWEFLEARVMILEVKKRMFFEYQALSGTG